MTDRNIQMKQFHNGDFRNLNPKTKLKNVTDENGNNLDKVFQDMRKEFKDFKDTIGDLLGGTSVKDYGAIGDGIADDTQAIIDALDNEDRLILSGIHRITRPIIKNLTRDTQIIGNDAKIICDFPTHYEHGLKLSGSGIKISIVDLFVDGMKRCNKVVDIANARLGMTDSNLTNLFVDNVEIVNAKRDKRFLHGAGIYIRGTMENVLLNNVKIKNCEMPAGQGVEGAQGIAGIGMSHNGETSYIKNIFVLACVIEKIYSSDKNYTSDQDGMSCISPTGKNVFARLTIRDSIFKNCYVRSIKTQIADTTIDGCRFEQDEGLNNKKFGDEVGIQYGGSVLNSTFIYKNNYSKNNTIAIGAAANLYRSKATVSNILVYNDGQVAIPKFVNTYPRNGFMSRVDIKNVAIYGNVTEFVDYRVSGDMNMLSVKECYLEGVTLQSNGDRALIYARASGTSPFYANIKVQDNMYDGNGVLAPVRDRITNVSMATNTISQHNLGFSS